MAIIRVEILLCRRQYFHQVCENLADGNHAEEQKQVQTTVVFCFLILLAICMPIFLIYNNTISQTGSKMEQCNSLLPRHPCPFCCHLPWFMVLENCHPFNQYLWCHTIDMQKDEKVNNPRCDKGGRKGILILCMVGRSTLIDYMHHHQNIVLWFLYASVAFASNNAKK